MWSGLDLAHLHWALVAGAGVLIGTLALVVGQQALRRGRAAPAAEPATVEGPAVDPFQFGSRDEKRQAFRRKGKYVEVDVTDEAAEQVPWRGWVLDRSIKGVRLGTDSDVPPGTILNVRVGNQKPPMPWLAVRVLHSNRSGQSYELGCEFITKPTWNIMLMFG